MINKYKYLILLAEFFAVLLMQRPNPYMSAVLFILLILALLAPVSLIIALVIQCIKGRKRKKELQKMVEEEMKKESLDLK